MTEYQNPYLRGSRHLDGLILACVAALVAWVVFA